MTPYEFIEKCKKNGLKLCLNLNEPWRIKVKGEPVDNINEVMEILRQDMEFQARVILALAHLNKGCNENDILCDLITEQQFIRAANKLPTDDILAVLDKMGWIYHDSK